MLTRSVAWLLLLALLAPTLTPSATAVEVPLLTDPTGDVAFFLGGGGVPEQAVPAPQSAETGNADLVSLAVDEVDDAFTFVLTVANLKTATSFGGYAIAFTWNGVEHRAQIFRSKFVATDDSVFLRAFLLQKQGSEFNRVADLDATDDPEKGTLAVVVPKVFVLDRSSRMPLKGDTLKDVHVLTEQQSIRILARSSFTDRMPDQGSNEFTFQLGGLATGHLLLGSADPVRVSNGGATTFVFQAVIRNTADFADEVALGVENLPEGWTARVQSPLTVPATSEKTVTVLTSVPFKHEHGGFSAFNLTAVSGKVPAAKAAIRLGVLHTPVPQPAGHHPDLFFHGVNLNTFEPFRTLFPFVTAFMNTDSNREGDEAYANPDTGSTRGDGSTVGWRIPLAPQLAMGLDFDVTKTGTFAGTVLGKMVADAEVSAALYYSEGSDDTFNVDPEEGILLADSTPVPVKLDVITPAAFTLTLEPLPEADYIPYTPGRNLWLVVTVHMDAFFICCLPSISPQLGLADAKLTLPLNEYHDRLDGLVAEAESGLSLVPEGVVERVGRPGDLLTYAFTMKNVGAKDDTFIIDVAGTDADLGTAAPTGELRLKAGESKRVTLGVRIPTEAQTGEGFEVLLFVRSQSDPSKIAIQRTKTQASLEEASSDETETLIKAQQDAGKKTPAPGAVLVLAALGAALLATRRRRA